MRLGTGDPQKYDFRDVNRIGTERFNYYQVGTLNISLGNTTNTASEGAVVHASSTSNTASGGSALATEGATATVTPTRERSSTPLPVGRVIVSILGFGVVVLSVFWLTDGAVEDLKLGPLELGASGGRFAGVVLGVLAMVAPWVRLRLQPGE